MSASYAGQCEKITLKLILAYMSSTFEDVHYKYDVDESMDEILFFPLYIYHNNYI